MKREMGFSDSEAKAIQKHTGKKMITNKTFNKLKVGEFICQVDNWNPRLFRVPKFLLGTKNSMSKKNREKTLARLKGTKYTKPFYVKQKEENNTSNHSLNHTIDGTIIHKKDKEKLLNQNQQIEQPKKPFRSKFDEES